MTPTERYKATKALKGFAKQDPSVEATPKNIATYVALAALAPKGKRIGFQTFKVYMDKKSEARCIVGRKYLMQFKSVVREVPRQLRGTLVDPASIQDLPRNIDPTQVWIWPDGVFQHVDPTLLQHLGHMLYIKSECHDVRPLCFGDGEDAISDSEDEPLMHQRPSPTTVTPRAQQQPLPQEPRTPSEPVTPGKSVEAPETSEKSSAASAASAASAPEDPKRKTRMLEHSPSTTSEHGDEQEADAFEEIARETSKAFASGKLVATQEGAPDTVEFWLRGYLQHVNLLRGLPSLSTLTDDDFVATLKSHVKLYLRYVVTELIKATQWPVSTLISCLAEIKAKYPSLPPRTTSVLIDLNTCAPTDSIQSLPSVKLLTASQMAFIFRSSMYLAFLRNRSALQYQGIFKPDLIISQLDNADLERLASSEMQDDQKKNVQFCIKLRHISAHEERRLMTWLLEPEFEGSPSTKPTQLSRLEPVHAKCKLLPLFTTDTKWN